MLVYAAFGLAIVALILALVALVRTRPKPPAEAVPVPLPPVPAVIPDEFTEMALYAPDGTLESRRVICGPPPPLFVRPHGKGKKQVYRRASRTGERSWRYERT